MTACVYSKDKFILAIIKRWSIYTLISDLFSKGVGRGKILTQLPR